MMGLRTLVTLALIIALLPTGARTQGSSPSEEEEDIRVTLDFQEADLIDVIEMIAKISKRNFLFDERVRGKVTVISPTPVTPEEAYRVFEAVLQVKGFTTIPGPGGILKIVPLRDAKASPIATVPGERAIPNRDLFITRLLPLRYVRAESLMTPLSGLKSSEASLIAYAPTNTLIITDTAANIRRLLSIISEIDVETYQEQIKVLPIEFADAQKLTNHLEAIFSEKTGAATTRAATPAARARRGRAAARTRAGAPGQVAGKAGEPRFIPDDRTNSIIVIAPQATIVEVERIVSLLDYQRKGSGRIHVYRLQNADSEEMAQTLASLVQGAGRPRAGAGAGAAAAQAAQAVAQLAGGIQVTADAPTNSLIIQASSEGYAALQEVIQALDIRRPQVLVEALIMEVAVNDSQALGASFVYQDLLRPGNDGRVVVGSATTASVPGSAFYESADGVVPGTNFTTAILGKTVSVIDREGDIIQVPIIQAIITASASDQDTNIISAPVILTADNEEAQIVVGENIPIPTTRLQTADTGATGGFQTSQNIERQDVGVTLRVTPQISEGDTIRLQIFQEISEVLSEEDVELGPTTSTRTVENTVYVRNREAVMIGGILKETETESLSKIPWLGDIPILGWAFKGTTKGVRKTNLLIVLTPSIVRDPEDLNQLTVEHRERFRDAAAESFEREEAEAAARERALAAGMHLPRDPNPVRREMEAHERKYPVESLPKMRRDHTERERQRVEELERLKAADQQGNYLVQVALFRKPADAVELLNQLLSSGYDGTVLSRTEGKETVHFVQLGPYAGEDRAQHVAREVRASTKLNAHVIIEP
jgi:general secretion pathway protein D